MRHAVSLTAAWDGPSSAHLRLPPKMPSPSRLSMPRALLGSRLWCARSVPTAALRTEPFCTAPPSTEEPDHQPALVRPQWLDRGLRTDPDSAHLRLLPKSHHAANLATERAATAATARAGGMRIFFLRDNTAHHQDPARDGKRGLCDNT